MVSLWRFYRRRYRTVLTVIQVLGKIALDITDRHYSYLNVDIVEPIFRHLLFSNVVQCSVEVMFNMI